MATLGLVLCKVNSIDDKPIMVLQETINNQVNTKINNIKENRREVMAVRKKTKPPTISVASLVSDQIRKSGAAKKAPRKEILISSSGNRGQPAPLAVARRNARERNRVRQVNNGFAALRQHIPEEVAEAFEGVNAAKSANKKLSKVETLRMAVEYIRSLENLLNIGDHEEGKENTYTYPSPASSSSPQDSSSFDQTYFSLQSPLMDDEDSDPVTPLQSHIGHSYIRIPGTNTYQIIPTTPSFVYEDDENMEPLTPSSDMIMQDDLIINPHLLDASMQFMNSTGQEFTVIPPHKLSNDAYEDHSSPISHITIDQMDVKFASNIQIIPNDTHILQEHVAISAADESLNTKLILRDEYQNEEKDNSLSDSEYFDEDIDLKKEIPDIDGDDMDFNSNEQQLDVAMGWWEQDERHEDKQS